MNAFKLLFILPLFFPAETLCSQEVSSKGELVKKEFDASAIGTAVDESKLYKFDTMEGMHDKKSSEALSALRSITELKAKKSMYTGDFKNLYDAEKRYFVVANVNSEVITNIDVLNAVKFIFFSSGKKYNKEDAKLMVNAVISSMIDSRLQHQYATACKIQIKDSEVDAKVEELAEKNNMTVEEMKSKFAELGINIDLFKRNIRARMILSIIVDMISEDIQISEQDVIEEQARIATDIKNPRYHINEIFFRVDDPKTKKRAKENAEAVLKLVKNGFYFSVLSENLSQGNYTGTIGDLGWVREESLESPVRSAVKKLNPGEYSEVIETRTGYKIIYLFDKAAPKKVGQSAARYKVLRSTIQYRGGFMTKKDEQDVNEKIGAIVDSDSASKYKQVCEKCNVKFDEQEIESPNSYESELIEKSKKTGKPAILQSIDDDDSVEILLVCGETIPDAEVPSKEAVVDIVAAKKVEKEFTRNLKKMRNTAHIVVFQNMLDQVL